MRNIEVQVTGFTRHGLGVWSHGVFYSVDYDRYCPCVSCVRHSIPVYASKGFQTFFLAYVILRVVV